MNWYFEAFKKYAVFQGRSGRKEYWFFVLFNIIVSAALAFLDRITVTFVADTGFGILSAVFTLAVILPGIAVSVRRLHDTGRSGWWFLVTIVPVLGFFLFIYFMVLESDPGSNKYGPLPNSSSDFKKL
jgi:uncharacterized membrane protein YhaH (DUF805 family)